MMAPKKLAKAQGRGLVAIVIGLTITGSNQYFFNDAYSISDYVSLAGAYITTVGAYLVGVHTGMKEYKSHLYMRSKKYKRLRG